MHLAGGRLPWRADILTFFVKQPRLGRVAGSIEEEVAERGHL
jgi:hypothetical protein